MMDTKGNGKGLGDIPEYVRSFGLNGSLIGNCLASDDHKGKINQDYEDGRRAGIADWLIDIYEIQDGLGLAHHLKVPNQLSNHDAVRVWVQQQLQSRPPAFQTLGDVRTALGSLLP